MLNAGKNVVQEWSTVKYNLVVNAANVFNPYPANVENRVSS